jgi:hypothetical protein
LIVSSSEAKLANMAKVTHIPLSDVPPDFLPILDLARQHGRVIIDRTDGTSIVVECLSSKHQEAAAQLPVPVSTRE